MCNKKLFSIFVSVIEVISAFPSLSLGCIARNTPSLNTAICSIIHSKSQRMNY